MVNQAEQCGSAIGFAAYVEGELRVPAGPAEAVPFYLAAIEGASRVGCNFVEGVARVSLGSALTRTGDHVKAAEVFAHLLPRCLARPVLRYLAPRSSRGGEVPCSAPRSASPGRARHPRAELRPVMKSCHDRSCPLVFQHRYIVRGVWVALLLARFGTTTAVGTRYSNARIEGHRAGRQANPQTINRRDLDTGLLSRSGRLAILALETAGWRPTRSAVPGRG